MINHEGPTRDGVGAALRKHCLEARSVSPDGWEPALLLHEQAPKAGGRGRPLLYVHGATFPSTLSVFFRFDGVSWADVLNEAGFTVFGLDFAGYGGSERYPSMFSEAPEGQEPEGMCRVAVRQVARAVRFITEATGAARVSVVAHSWGTMYPSGGSRLAGGRLGIEDVLTAARKDVRFDHGAGDDTGGTGASPSLER